MVQQSRQELFRNLMPIDTVVDLAEDTASETKNASERVKASANKANTEKKK